MKTDTFIVSDYLLAIANGPSRFISNALGYPNEVAIRLPSDLSAGPVSDD
jgi:hypothetical protein